MADRNDEIKYMKRPQYAEFPPMSMEDRAAQFSPFAALVGYGDAVAETARLTDSRRVLTEDENDELNYTLNLLEESIVERPEVMVRYFVPDEKKSGGHYEEKTGEVRTVDHYENMLIFTDGDRIPLGDISALSINIEE
ncbi:MAG: hypothetical protein IJM55_07505 [Ruminococcus sp.]|nr:hypothetical protein [Ruminococcus sp.]